MPRDRFETGKLNAVHAFGDDAMPRHGLYRWHLQDPICLPKIYRSLYNKSATMMFAYLSGKTMLLVSLTGIQQKLQEILNVISLIENACRVNEVFSHIRREEPMMIWGN